MSRRNVVNSHVMIFAEIKDANTSEQGGEVGEERRLRVAVFTVCSCVRGRFFDNQRGERRTRAEVGGGEVTGGEVGAACR